MAAYGFTAPRRGPIRTRSISPTTASAGALRKRPVPQYVERESRNRADDATRTEVLKLLRQAVGQGAAPGGPSGLPGGTSSPLRLPRVPVEPVQGNPYKGLDAAIGRFAQASAKRGRGDAAAARKALAGRSDPGADITGSFNAQALGMAGELAAVASNLRNQARADYASAELERRGQLAKNKYDARSAQIKNDATLMEQAGIGGQGISLSMIQQAASEGIDWTQFANNPVGLSVALGRARFARRGELGLPPTAWAQAAQYGLQPPTAYGSQENFYWALGQAKAGAYGGAGDVAAVLQLLQSRGLLEGMGGG